MDHRHAFAEMVPAGGDDYVDQEVRNFLKEYRVQVVGTNTSGGFTVSTTLAKLHFREHEGAWPDVFI